MITFSKASAIALKLLFQYLIGDIDVKRIKNIIDAFKYDIVL
jgi:hypothetical protein